MLCCESSGGSRSTDDLRVKETSFKCGLEGGEALTLIISVRKSSGGATAAEASVDPSSNSRCTTSGGGIGLGTDANGPKGGVVSGRGDGGKIFGRSFVGDVVKGVEGRLFSFLRTSRASSSGSLFEGAIGCALLVDLVGDLVTREVGGERTRSWTGCKGSWWSVAGSVMDDFCTGETAGLLLLA